MSRTDHHRPYQIQADDPLTPLRYQSDYLMGIRFSESDWVLPYRVHVHPPRDALRAYFYGPQRAAVRDWSRAVVAAYRSGDEIPVEPDGRARNSVKYLWW